jgi:choline-sulfatase
VIRKSPIPAPLILSLALAGAGCAGADSDAGRLNVLLIVIDTARADKFGCYGHEGGLTPRIDTLAAEGVLFENAAAHAPWTLPSTASLLSSLHPQEHGAGGFLDLGPLAEGAAPVVAFRGLAPEVETVTEAFHDDGWRTGAIVNVDFLDREFGLTQGVDDLDAAWYESNQQVRSATQTTDLALEWLTERGDEPFFLLTHYFDAHAVYAPPAEFRSRFAAPPDRQDPGFVFGTRQHMLLLRAGKLELDPPLIERAERLYEAELAYVDAQVGRLLDGLQRLGIEDDTLVVLTADHGEEFLDHGGFEHGHTLYDELTRVPLVLRLPGHLPPGRAVPGVAALVDVAPTLCELAGIETPSSFVGRSLTDALHGGDLTARPILAHGNFWGQPLVSWRSGRWKLILNPQHPGENEGAEPRVELYDLDADPAEREDLASREPQRVKLLRAEYEEVRAHLVNRARGAPVELNEEGRRRLQALGYLGADDSDLDGTGGSKE